jgi:hypothetical protein
MLPFVKDFGVPGIPLLVALDHPAHKTEDVLIAGKDDMRATGIEGESSVGFRAAEPAIPGLRFENCHIIATFVKQAGKRKACKTAAKDCGCHWK